jgi:hypothetical protein
MTDGRTHTDQHGITGRRRPLPRVGSSSCVGRVDPSGPVWLSCLVWGPTSQTLHDRIAQTVLGAAPTGHDRVREFAQLGRDLVDRDVLQPGHPDQPSLLPRQHPGTDRVSQDEVGMPPWLPRRLGGEPRTDGASERGVLVDLP